MLYAPYAVQYSSDQNKINAYEYKGYLDMHFGRYQDALAAYDQLLKMVPKHANAYYMRGFALLNLGQRAAACASFNNALSLGDTRAQEALDTYCK